MKKLYILLAAITILFTTACKKDGSAGSSNLAAISFVNATVSSAALVPKFGNTNLIYSQIGFASRVNYGASNLFSWPGGSTTISLTQATDTTHTVFAGNLNLQAGGIYSLYLTGTVAQPDTVFMQEHLIQHASTDSVAGIRFVNLSPVTGPVSVGIKGLSNGSEVTSLPYKGRTVFKTYKADRTVASYIFEFRDAASGTLLATYTLNGVNNSSSARPGTTNSVRFRNQTIALIGGGTTAISAILIANY
jgi:hypothetical protein